MRGGEIERGRSIKPRCRDLNDYCVSIWRPERRNHVFFRLHHLRCKFNFQVNSFLSRVRFSDYYSCNISSVSGIRNLFTKYLVSDTFLQSIWYQKPFYKVSGIRNLFTSAFKSKKKSIKRMIKLKESVGYNILKKKLLFLNISEMKVKTKSHFP